MKSLVKITLLVGMAVLCGCMTVNRTVVSVTEIRDSIMKELAQLSKEGKIDLATDAKIALADEKFRQAAEQTKKALIAYKEGQGKGEFYAALQTTKVALDGLLSVLAPYITQQEVTDYKLTIVNAAKL